MKARVVIFLTGEIISSACIFFSYFEERTHSFFRRHFEFCLHAAAALLQWLDFDVSHGCKESGGAETVTVILVVVVIVFLSIMVKYLQTIGHGEQIALHFVLIQVIGKVIVIVEVVFKVVVVVFDVDEAPAPGL